VDTTISAALKGARGVSRKGKKVVRILHFTSWKEHRRLQSDRRGGGKRSEERRRGRGKSLQKQGGEGVVKRTEKVEKEAKSHHYSSYSFIRERHEVKSGKRETGKKWEGLTGGLFLGDFRKRNTPPIIFGKRGRKILGKKTFFPNQSERKMTT